MRDKNITEDLKQNWTQNSYDKSYTDQFGFKIRYGRMFTIEHRGKAILKLHTLAAAKEVSKILLNDKIFNSQE